MIKRMLKKFNSLSINPMLRVILYGKILKFVKMVYMHLGGSVHSGPPVSGIYPVHLPLQPDEKEGFKLYPLFYKETMSMSLESHVSALTKGRSPHPPHKHEEEEILVLLAGEVDLILPDRISSKGETRLRLKANQLVYYPAGFSHTLCTVSEAPANYLMFKWKRNFMPFTPSVSFGLYDIMNSNGEYFSVNGFHPQLVFEGSTKYLQKLHCHTSTLTAGAGYKPHSDLYSVAIIVLEGEVETLGRRIKPYGVIFYGAGEPHGMHNPGRITARYIVFEFHRE